MSTTSGENTWTEVGLAPPEDDDAIDSTRIAADIMEEHPLDAPRPDLRDEANESDVVEQAFGVLEDDDEAYPEA